MDANFNKHCSTTNRGWCVCDHLKNFIIASVTWDPRNLFVIEAEALILKEAIHEAINLHLKNVIFEIDSQ